MLFPPLLFTLLTLLTTLTSITSTKIKFTPGDKTNTPAHTAPRSQKYWNTHSIKRPEYGKTDYEVWVESDFGKMVVGMQKYVPWGEEMNMAVLVGVCVVVVSFLVWKFDVFDSSTDNNNGEAAYYVDTRDEETRVKEESEARNARLLRFQDNTSVSAGTGEGGKIDELCEENQLDYLKEKEVKDARMKALFAAGE